MAPQNPYLAAVTRRHFFQQMFGHAVGFGIGSTALEPWRRDSTPGFELAHATLQTVRRWARVRVIPVANQYLIDVKVYKELEDLEAPEGSVVTGRGIRHDNSLDRDTGDIWLPPPNRGWIPLGRDFALEETILNNLQARFERVGRTGNGQMPH